MEIGSTFKESVQLGRIFKTPDFHVLTAICFLVEENYASALESFEGAIAAKEKECEPLEEMDETERLEARGECESFTNQMLYNMTLCEMALGREGEAAATVGRIAIPIEQSYYADYVGFRRFVEGASLTCKKEEVFPSRNKLSNHLQRVTLTRQGNTYEFKLCIAFPKV